jgi:hypothetical protein
VSSTVDENSKYIVKKHGWQRHLAGSIQLEFFGGKKNWRKPLLDSSRLSSKYKLQCLTCGLYYEPTTIVNDDSRVINKLEASLTDDARVIIYDHYMFIVQATGQVFSGKLS